MNELYFVLIAFQLSKFTVTTPFRDRSQLSLGLGFKHARMHEIENQFELFFVDMLSSGHFLLLILHASDSEVKNDQIENLKQARGGSDDYWDEDFDQGQNCAQKERIAELSNNVGIDYCRVAFW